MKNLQTILKRAHACEMTSILQLRVFLALGDMPRETTAREISDATGIEACQVSGVLKFLENWDLVWLEKRPDVIDGRRMMRIHARLTPEGNAAMDILNMEVAL
jgi:DNA-binding MarR family transcriptional regulator